jgi:hypothetical protein
VSSCVIAIAFFFCILCRSTTRPVRIGRPVVGDSSRPTRLNPAAVRARLPSVCPSGSAENTLMG